MKKQYSTSLHKIPFKTVSKKQYSGMLETAVYVSSATISNLLTAASNPPSPTQSVINVFRKASES